jgi:hypothetical protein
MKYLHLFVITKVHKDFRQYLSARQIKGANGLPKLAIFEKLSVKINQGDSPKVIQISEIHSIIKTWKGAWHTQSLCL